jgi:hypothetical protein
LRVVTVLAEMPHVVVATPNLPVKNLQELTALAKQEPGSINFGSAGVGSSVHMMGSCTSCSPVLLLFMFLIVAALPRSTICLAARSS